MRKSLLKIKRYPFFVVVMQTQRQRKSQSGGFGTASENGKSGRLRQSKEKCRLLAFGMTPCSLSALKVDGRLVVTQDNIMNTQVALSPIRFVCQFMAITFLLAAPVDLRAQHYPAGSEGVKAGSLPPPGFYVKDYNSFYFFNQTPGFGGQLNLLEGFNYVQSPRLMWMTDLKILGADFGMAVRVPIAYKQITHRVTAATGGGGTGQIPGGSPGSYPGQTFPPLGSFPGQGGPLPGTSPFTKTQFGLADIEIQPVLLSWHLSRFDFSTGYSFWAPTGDSDFKNRFFVDNLGAGYWTHSFMLGITWYPDAEKTWAVSVLNHYDINTAQYSGLYD